ncbi:chemotaxis protein CheW [Chamaesiphon sp. VAR_48_metabat_135_sub]|uniref:chemotaxis protein CheW n=1 Tax=Chamaesiphon sp. VAR_48_metabat_135_sub TaxID=2964699 RepID=UPI00286A580B|nr:chemotaxis protein CheW [Chamaesiphon sp. VAR_48_metabat_135_sub]
MSSSSLVDSDRSTYQQFLRFQLQPNLMALIEIELVTELVNILVDRVVPMPHLPSAVMGVYNWRGEILWIVDLAMLLGCGSPRRYRSLQPTMILTSNLNSEDRQQKTIGFVVDEIAELELCDLDLIESPLPDNIYPEFSDWARGLWSSTTGESFLVLNGATILDRASFHADV